MSKETQSLVVKDVTLERIVYEAERTLDRKLTEMEKSVLQYGVEKIRLGLV